MEGVIVPVVGVNAVSGKTSAQAVASDMHIGYGPHHSCGIEALSTLVHGSKDGAGADLFAVKLSSNPWHIRLKLPSPWAGPPTFQAFLRFRIPALLTGQLPAGLCSIIFCLPEAVGYSGFQ